MKVVTSVRTLMGLAGQLGQARKRGDPDEIAKAEQALKDYEEACLQADVMSLEMTCGELAAIGRGRANR